jgi:zinc protease
MAQIRYGVLWVGCLVLLAGAVATAQVKTPAQVRTPAQTKPAQKEAFAPPQTAASATAASPATKAGLPRLPHRVFTLANGLQVIVAPDRSLPLVAVNLWYHVGSGDEVPGKSGFAHLFEHMMFQGAKHIGEDVHFDVLKQAGASQINGTTNTDRTNYFEQVPSHHLQTALWLESDRMGWLLDTLNQKSLDNQREVVRNERRQRYDNVPYGQERFEVHRLLYPEGHPYRHLTIGLHEDLQRASVTDVQGFFAQWYVPANATLCLAGDVDPASVAKLVGKWFGSLPARAKPRRTPVAMPQLEAAVSTEVRDPLARLRRLHWAWHSPAIYQDGDAALDVLAHALGHAGSGRLYKRLVHELQWAQSVQVHQASAQWSSVFHVVVDVKPGVDLAQVRHELQQAFTAVRIQPLQAAERDRAVLDVESALVWNLESLMARCETLQAYNHYLGKPDGLARDLQRYRDASVAAIQATAARWLVPERRVEVLTVPAVEGAK